MRSSECMSPPSEGGTHQAGGDGRQGPQGRMVGVAVAPIRDDVHGWTGDHDGHDGPHLRLPRSDEPPVQVDAASHVLVSWAQRICEFFVYMWAGFWGFAWQSAQEVALIGVGVSGLDFVERRGVVHRLQVAGVLTLAAVLVPLDMGHGHVAGAETVVLVVEAGRLYLPSSLSHAQVHLKLLHVEGSLKHSNFLTKAVGGAPFAADRSSAMGVRTATQ